MAFLRSLTAAFSCFSVVPVPQTKWDEAGLRYLMAAFPLVGVVSSALVFGWCLLADALGAGPLLRAVGIAGLPLVFSGGIHLDGFADVVDAQASHAPVERRRAILKDPHIGAFAAMGVTLYLLLYTALAAELPGGWHAAALLACIQVLVRCESGLGSLLLAGASGGMLATFREAAPKRASVALLGAEGALVAAAMLALSPVAGGAMLAVGLVCLVGLGPFARRAFGGMSGDVAGFFLQVCELALLACLVVAAWVLGW